MPFGRGVLIAVTPPLGYIGTLQSPMPFGRGVLIAVPAGLAPAPQPAESPMPFGRGVLIAVRKRISAGSRRLWVTNAFRPRGADRPEEVKRITIWHTASPMPFGRGVLIALSSKDAAQEQ